MILAAVESGIWSTIGSILLSLVVTFLFNYFIGLPKKFKDAKKAEQAEKDELAEANRKRDKRLDKLEEAVDNLPAYREQSKKIQEELKQADTSIVDLCQTIKDEVMANRKEVLFKLDRLEEREKNALRAKILEEHRLYTDESKNPMKAWSEMEEHSFRKLVEDYEALGGNDYVHDIVVPDMNRLDVVPMSNVIKLKELYDSRKVK